MRQHVMSPDQMEQQLREVEADLARTREERDDLRVQLSEGTDDVVPYTAHAWRARCRQTMQERDDARAALLNLLAVIHRDGGHYTDEHGISESARDAKDVVVGLRAALTECLKYARFTGTSGVDAEARDRMAEIARAALGAATDTREAP